MYEFVMKLTSALESVSRGTLRTYMKRTQTQNNYLWITYSVFPCMDGTHSIEHSRNRCNDLFNHYDICALIIHTHTIIIYRYYIDK